MLNLLVRFIEALSRLDNSKLQILAWPALILLAVVLLHGGLLHE